MMLILLQQKIMPITMAWSLPWNTSQFATGNSWPTSHPKSTTWFLTATMIAALIWYACKCIQNPTWSSLVPRYVCMYIAYRNIRIFKKATMTFFQCCKIMVNNVNKVRIPECTKFSVHNLNQKMICICCRIYQHSTIRYLQKM